MQYIYCDACLLQHQCRLPSPRDTTHHTSRSQFVDLAAEEFGQESGLDTCNGIVYDSWIDVTSVDNLPGRVRGVAKESPPT